MPLEVTFFSEMHPDHRKLDRSDVSDVPRVGRGPLKFSSYQSRRSQQREHTAHGHVSRRHIGAVPLRTRTLACNFRWQLSLHDWNGARERLPVDTITRT